MLDEKDFSERLKVDLSETDTLRTLSSSRDVYTCLKLMKDLSKVKRFILAA